MYNSYFPMGYQPAAQAAPQQQQGIVWVQGESGAKAHLVAAGNSVLLMDSEDSVFYIKSTDASGMPMPLRVFEYTERTTQKQPEAHDYVTREELEQRLAELRKEETGA